MRILHLISTLGGGGAERQLGLLAVEQVRRGDTVAVGCLEGGLHNRLLTSNGVELHEIGRGRAHSPMNGLAVWNLVRRFKPHVVQTWLLAMDVLGGMAARWSGIPWILTERASAPAYASRAKDQLRMRLGRQANAVVANSAEGLAYWAPRLSPGTLQAVVPNAVPLREVEVASRETPLVPLPPAPLILFAGRLAPQKNLETLLSALELVLQATSASALLLGEGPDRPGVEEWIRSRGLSSRIVLSGFRPDLWAVMARSSVLVSLSHFEGQPNVVLEAMACGCPLVVSDIPTHRAFLDARTACIVPATDARAAAAAIIQSLERSPERADRIAAARARVRTFTIDQVAQGYDVIYKRLLSGARR